MFKKVLVLSIISVIFSGLFSGGYADTIIKNKLFSISVPEEMKGFYRTEIKKDSISFFDKDSVLFENLFNVVKTFKWTKYNN